MQDAHVRNKHVLQQSSAAWGGLERQALPVDGAQGLHSLAAAAALEQSMTAAAHSAQATHDQLQAAQPVATPAALQGPAQHQRHTDSGLVRQYLHAKPLSLDEIKSLHRIGAPGVQRLPGESSTGCPPTHHAPSLPLLDCKKTILPPLPKPAQLVEILAAVGSAVLSNKPSPNLLGPMQALFKAKVVYKGQPMEPSQLQPQPLSTEQHHSQKPPLVPPARNQRLGPIHSPTAQHSAQQQQQQRATATLQQPQAELTAPHMRLGAVSVPVNNSQLGIRLHPAANSHSITLHPRCKQPLNHTATTSQPGAASVHPVAAAAPATPPTYDSHTDSPPPQLQPPSAGATKPHVHVLMAALAPRADLPSASCDPDWTSSTSDDEDTAAQVELHSPATAAHQPGPAGTRAAACPASAPGAPHQLDPGLPAAKRARHIQQVDSEHVASPSASPHHWTRPVRGYTSTAEAADLVNKIVEIPGTACGVGTPGALYRAQVLHAEQHSNTVVIKMLDDGSRYYFSIGQVRHWYKETLKRYADDAAADTAVVGAKRARDAAGSLAAHVSGAQPSSSVSEHSHSDVTPVPMPTPAV